MKFIRIGLTKESSTSLVHNFVCVKGDKGLSFAGFNRNGDEISCAELGKPAFFNTTNANLLIRAKNGRLNITESGLPNSNHGTASLLVVRSLSELGNLYVSLDKSNNAERVYEGQLFVIAQDNHIRIVLKCPLEDYVMSVLVAEMPATYNLEAIKAQAVSARTYGLRPRINHQQDLCDVCDSFLCCQAFSGRRKNENAVYMRAIEETKSEVLIYDDEPILALFSSCAGGHTENYEDCFLESNFGIVPHLRGVSEFTPPGRDQLFDEATLKMLWKASTLPTFDFWSKKFRWSYRFSVEDLESTMHQALTELMARQDFAPFIVPPSSQVFGYLQGFFVQRRGVGGTAIDLLIATSKGKWKISKELAIRNLFRNIKLGLQRLPSAKIFFEESRDSKNRLQSIAVYGFGNGHGVGLQQVGAEGMARMKINYRDILAHYYSSVELGKIS